MRTTINFLISVICTFGYSQNSCSEEPLYLLNGIEVNKSVIDELNTECISSTEEIDARQAIDLYGEKGQYGAINVQTTEYEFIKDSRMHEGYTSTHYYLADQWGWVLSRMSIPTSLSTLQNVSILTTILIDDQESTAADLKSLSSDDILSISIYHHSAAEILYPEVDGRLIVIRLKSSL